MKVPMNALLFVMALVTGLPAAIAAQPAKVTVAKKNPFGAEWYLVTPGGKKVHAE